MPLQRDFSSWTQIRLVELLNRELVIPESKGLTVSFGKAIVSGEAVSNIRKGGKIVTYDLVVSVPFTGSLKGLSVEGTLSLPTLSEESESMPSLESKAKLAQSWKVVCRPVISDIDGHLDGPAMDRIIRKQRVVEKVVQKEAVPKARQAVECVLIELREK